MSLNDRSAPCSLARLASVILTAFALVGLVVPRAHATEQLCDSSFENCRTQLLDLINNENVEIDVGLWFMEDSRYSAAIIRRWNAGVPVRILMDPRATATDPINGQIMQDLANAGVPMRKRIASGIEHWKMMLLAGQGMVEFGSANFSNDGFVPVDPYKNYVDETVYYTDDPSVVNSFKTKFDDAWTDTVAYANFANASGPLLRSYPTFSIDPELNFPPSQDFGARSVKAYKAEAQTAIKKIDVIMYRITDRRHTDALINLFGQGVAVRLIGDHKQYRSPSRLWDAWNIDRLYAAGIPIRMNAHLGINHDKLVLLYGQGMTIFGSSNWTSPSAVSQHEHNYFTKNTSIFNWFVSQFERKWNNTNPIGAVETKPFTPLPPDKPAYASPANGATGVATSGVVLKWNAGPWAHVYDIYFGTAPNPPLLAGSQNLGPSQTPTDYRKFSLPTLAAGTTYYWRIVSKTMANLTAGGPTWSFTTTGTTPPPPPGATTEVMWAKNVPSGSIHGAWTLISDATAAGGSALQNPDAGHAKITPALAGPGSYFETTFDATSGTAYHLWVRMRAQGNSFSNDSIHVQFSDSVDAVGTPAMRIGTSSSAQVVLEDGATLAPDHGWGWGDNGWGSLGANIYFATTGSHVLRVQQREDGAIVDQIVLSPDPGTYLNAAPGPRKDDTTILPSTDGSGGGGGGGGSLPSPWADSDIGAVSSAGSATYSSGTFSVTATGADIWGTADAFHYVYQTFTGDGSITARVASLQQVSTWSKAGVMFRETLDANSRQAFMLVSSAKGVAMQWRPTTGGTSLSAAGSSSAPPRWVRLVRSGTTFAGYESANGSTWTLVSSQTISMGATVFVGLAATSHNTSASTTAAIDNAAVATTVASNLPSPWVDEDVGAVGASGSAQYDPGTATFMVRGSGADIWGTADAFNFVYEPLDGDGTIMARVASLTDVDRWSKAGVMIRDTLDASSAHAFMLVSAEKGVAFQWRGAAAATSSNVAGSVSAPPRWVKLERAGDQITGYESSDGTSWTEVTSQSIPMTGTVYVGLAVTSHDNGQLTTADFDDVSAP